MRSSPPPSSAARLWSSSSCRFSCRPMVSCSRGRTRDRKRLKIPAAAGEFKAAGSAELVAGGREQDAGAAGLAVDATVDAARLGADVIARMEHPVVDQQLAVEEVQLFDAA